MNETALMRRWKTLELLQKVEKLDLSTLQSANPSRFPPYMFVGEWYQPEEGHMLSFMFDQESSP